MITIGLMPSRPARRLSTDRRASRPGSSSAPWVSAAAEAYGRLGGIRPLCEQILGARAYQELRQIALDVGHSTTDLVLCAISAHVMRQEGEIPVRAIVSLARRYASAKRRNPRQRRWQTRPPRR